VVVGVFPNLIRRSNQIAQRYPGAARHITDGRFECDREVEDAIYRIDHVIECNTAAAEAI
jgi:hypothetical protein